MGHRYYDPLFARFVSRDPIGYEGGINLYAYCGNNPIIGIDPSGTDTLDWIQGSADVVGLAPGVGAFGDLTSGGISLYKGDWFGAGLSLAGVIPFLGDTAVGAKIARRANNIRKEVAEANALRKGLKNGNIVKLERYGSEAEALASEEANMILRREGHPNGKKWIGEWGTTNPATLGKAGNYTHKMTIYVKKEALTWLQNAVNAEQKDNEARRYGVHGHKVDEFNKFVHSLTSEKLKSISPKAYLRK